MKDIVLEFKNISKRYDKIKALKDVSFSIPKNSIFGILGANGSGKSTFMKILPGLIYNWSGKIFYLNNLIEKGDNKLKNDFGYLIESPTFYEYLSARKNLEILSRISNVNSKNIDTVLKTVNLSHRSNDHVSTYSYGMKQRLGIAQALLHDPEIVVLDEPNNGLDPNGIQEMVKIIKRLKSEGKTIILSTHNLKDVEEICTDFAIFKEGVCTITSSMKKQLKKSNMWLINAKETKKAIELINSIDSYKIINSFNNNILVKVNDNSGFEEISKLLNSIKIYKISKESNLIEHFND